MVSRMAALNFGAYTPGLIDPPEAFAPAENVLTQDAVEEWVASCGKISGKSA